MKPMLPTPNPDVIHKAVAGSAVLFHTRQEVYFGLNEVGSRVWELLPPACSELDELCAVLHAEYPEVDFATLRTDVAELIEELTVHGLLTASTPEHANGIVAVPVA
jgi:hypothetical protein